MNSKHTVKSKITHTPGPWMPTSDESISICTRTPSPEGFERICTMNCNEELFPRPIRQANARLIAAAPDLLEACQEVMGAFQDHYDGAPDASYQWAELMQKLECAITKAEGQSV